MIYARTLAVLAGLMAVSAFFCPLLMISGEPVTLFGQGYIEGFIFVLSGVIVGLMALTGKMKHLFWPSAGLLLSGVAFTEKLKTTLNETVASYEKFKEFLANQAQSLGVEVEAAQNLDVSWEFGLYLAMASQGCVLLAYGAHALTRGKALPAPLTPQKD